MAAVTRREFGMRTLGGVSASMALRAAGVFGLAEAAPPPAANRSYIGGVQFGLQPFCYHDLPMVPENRPTLIRRLVQNGMGMVELHATWVEPRFEGARQDAREQLRAWRLGDTAAHFRRVRRELDDAGIVVFTYYVNFSETMTDGEIDAIFEGARILGARGCVGSQGLAMSRRASAFPRRHGMFLGIHNHDNLSDPDAFATEASFEAGLAFGPDVKATLDTRHFVAANGDCLGFLERHHDRISSVHLGDRRKNNGRSAPFGEGDAPLIEILRLIRDNEWPIVALLEFEHGTLRPAVDEVQLMFDYCKRAVLS